MKTFENLLLIKEMITIQYNNVNVTLSYPKINKLKSAINNATEVTEKTITKYE